jgi:hypothetical protein
VAEEFVERQAVDPSLPVNEQTGPSKALNGGMGQAQADTKHTTQSIEFCRGLDDQHERDGNVARMQRRWVVSRLFSHF